MDTNFAAAYMRISRVGHLTNLCQASHKMDIYKQCTLRADATERGIWSESTLFALNTGISMKHIINTNQTPLLLEIDQSKDIRQ